MTGSRKRPTRNRHGAEGAVWRRITAYVAARDYGVCHVCGHTGATGADHDPHPVTERPDLSLDTANMKAAHTWPHPCPVCSPAAVARGFKPVYCNEIKQGMSADRARRIIETRTGLTLGPKTGGQPQGERDWLLPAAARAEAVPLHAVAAIAHLRQPLPQRAGSSVQQPHVVHLPRLRAGLLLPARMAHGADPYGVGAAYRALVVVPGEDRRGELLYFHRG
jgi:hypothetical protein